MCIFELLLLRLKTLVEIIKTPPFLRTQLLMNYICSTVRESVMLTKTSFSGSVFEAQSAVAVITVFMCLENTESACKSIFLLKNKVGTEEPFELALLFTKTQTLLPVLSCLSCSDFFSTWRDSWYNLLILILLLNYPSLKWNIVIGLTDPSSYFSLKMLYIIYDSLNMLNHVFLKLYSWSLHWTHNWIQTFHCWMTRGNLMSKIIWDHLIRGFKILNVSSFKYEIINYGGKHSISLEISIHWEH